MPPPRCPPSTPTPGPVAAGAPSAVVARTSALREDLPVVGSAQVVETWSDTAIAIARRYRRLGGEFTIGDVADAVDVSCRQVRRVGGGAGVATRYQPADTPGAGEVELPDRGAVDAEPGHSPHNQYYAWNVRVNGGDPAPDAARDPPPVRQRGAPPSPTKVEGPPGD